MGGEKVGESEGKRRKMFRLHRHKHEKSGHKFHFNFSGFHALQVSFFSLYILFSLVAIPSVSHLFFRFSHFYCRFFSPVFVFEVFFLYEMDIWSFFFCFFSFFFPMSATVDELTPSNFLFYWKVELDWIFFLLLLGKSG